MGRELVGASAIAFVGFLIRMADAMFWPNDRMTEKYPELDTLCDWPLCEAIRAKSDIICILRLGHLEQHTIPDHSASHQNLETPGPMYASGAAVGRPFEGAGNVRCDLQQNRLRTAGHRIVHIQVCVHNSVNLHLAHYR